MCKRERVGEGGTRGGGGAVAERSDAVTASGSPPKVTSEPDTSERTQRMVTEWRSHRAAVLRVRLRKQRTHALMAAGSKGFGRHHRSGHVSIRSLSTHQELRLRSNQMQLVISVSV